MANRYASKSDNIFVENSDTKCQWNWPCYAVKCEEVNYHMLAWGIIDNVNQSYHSCFKQLQVPLQGSD